MKTISTQLSYFLENKEVRRNLPLLMRVIALVVAVVVVFSILFHFIMYYAEGEWHSWVTGFYWTLTVMSTLGFGDITFTTDIGRAFSVVVLVTGIILLLVVLPFAFIRFFYAPWLKAQLQNRAPREVPPGTEGHVIITNHDALSPGFISALDREGIPYFLLGPDAATASDWYIEGLSAVTGDIDDKETYAKLNADKARLILANRTDAQNTNMTLTAREVAPDVPIAAVAHDDNAVDVLELSGATHVLPLKRWLGEQLASRVQAQQVGVQPLGEYGDLKIAEMPVRGTSLSGKTIRETELRQETGVHIIGVWERGPLEPPSPDHKLTDASVPVVMGTESQLRTLHDRFAPGEAEDNPVVVIGGGTVGQAAIRALARQGIPVNLVELQPERCDLLRDVCENVYQGDASNYAILQKAGISEASAVLLTTNEDAINVYLASYCRNLNAGLRVVSRITHSRNLEAIYRAGADFVLSYSTLGVDALMSILRGKDLVVLGEGVDIYERRVPESLAGHTLRESNIGAHTGLNVVALKKDGHTVTELGPDLTLEADMELLLIGSNEQLGSFIERYE